MAVNEQGHAGKYSGNSRHSYNHAHTRVTAGNYEATKRDDEAHMDYLKRDVLYDDHHGHSDEKMTADEKHISKLAGDLKYDEKHHGPGDFKGGYHKVLHAEGKAHQGPAKDPKKEDKPKGGRVETRTPQELNEYLKKREEKQKQDLLNKYKPQTKPTD
jgi:hypothetical protein